MNLVQMFQLNAGGPGSGCRGDRCGRPRTGASKIPHEQLAHLLPLMYHGTSSALKAKIMKEGFIPGAGKGADAWALKHWGRAGAPPTATAPRAVYMTPSLQEARRFAAAASEMYPAAKPVIAEIQPPDESIGKFKHDEQSDDSSPAVEYQGKIPPSWIKGWLTGDKAKLGEEGGFKGPDSLLTLIHAAKSRSVYAVFLVDGD